jgi:hypothetical protein
MKNLNRQLQFAVLLISTMCLWTTAQGQITPSGDAYTNTATPTTNLGTKPLLDVESATQTTYIQFDLSSIPSGYTSASIAKATLKLYVNAVTTAGSFNVDYVNGSWSERTITAALAPALGTTIVSSVPLTSANVHDFILIDVTPALGAWLDGTEPNDGIALVANSPLNASFDSKENTTNSQPAELDIVFAGGGTLTGLTTAGGSGLTGGGTSGTLNLGLTKSCAANQVLQWKGSSWACAAVGTGTITGVTAGTGLLGGGISGNVALNLDTTKIPELSSANTFTGNQTVNGNLNIVNNGSYQPFSVQSSSTFGSWMTLSNTSAGGHTWNLISAGGGNAEGAGNFGITDLTGKSTIWLEGNVNAGSLATGSTAINNMGCGGSFGGIGFGVKGSTGCANYSLLGEGVHTYLNRPTGGQILFRENNATEMVLAAGGNLGIGTTTPQFPLHVNGTVRAETGLSLGGNAVLSVDAPGVPGGQFQVSNGKVSIGGDTPMGSNPHMTFSGFILGGFCGDLSCGGASWSTLPGGFLVPDKNITITRMSVAVDGPVDPSCGVMPILSLYDTKGGFPPLLGGVGTTLFNFTLSSAIYMDSGAIAVPVNAGTQLAIVLGRPASSCTVGSSAGGNAFINVQYVMQ